MRRLVWHNLELAPIAKRQARVSRKGSACWRDSYEDVLSIEHADQTMDPIQAVSESVALLGRAGRIAQPAASPEK